MGASSTRARDDGKTMDARTTPRRARRGARDGGARRARASRGRDDRA